MMAPMVNLTSRAACPALLVVALSLGCSKSKPDDKPTATSATAAVPTTPATPAATPAAPTGDHAASSGAAAPPAGSPPKDGKYERVQVEGVTVPMIQVMNGGTVVLVDTDGKKPRTWEEQYKRKREGLLPGQFDIHKTDKNHNDKFDDDEIDKEGLWVIDAQGNITKH